MQSTPGATDRLSPRHQDHPTCSKAPGGRSNAHRCRGHGTPHVTKNQHSPRATFPCKVVSPPATEEMSPPEGQLLPGVTYLYPSHLHSLIARLLFSVLLAHCGRQDPCLSPRSTLPRRKGDASPLSAPRQSPSRTAAASQGQALCASRTCSAKKSLTKDER